MDATRLFCALPVGDKHLTLQFIGEWPEARLEEVMAALGGVGWQAFDFTVSGLGGFPNLRHPRVIFAQVEPNPALTALVAEIAGKLASIGIEREARPFTPHVTLKRVKGSGTPRVEPLAGVFHADRFALYESRSGRYIVRRWFPAASASQAR